MSKLLVVLLALVFSGTAMAFTKEKAKSNSEDVPASQPAAQPAATPISQPTQVTKLPAKKVEVDVITQQLQDAAKARAADDKRVKAAKRSEVTKAKSEANTAISAEKKKENETLAFLKADKYCGNSTVYGVSTTGSANAYHEIREYYTPENAPESVKNIILKHVDACDKYQKVGKYYPVAKKVETPVASKVAHEKEPEKTAVKEDDPGKQVSDFFGKLGHDIQSSGVKDKVCSPAETQMHANNC